MMQMLQFQEERLFGAASMIKGWSTASTAPSTARSARPSARR
jgi:hypothetical protein